MLHVKVLAIEDSPDYAALIAKWLSGKIQNLRFEVVLTESLTSATKHLSAEDFGVVLAPGEDACMSAGCLP